MMNKKKNGFVIAGMLMICGSNAQAADRFSAQSPDLEVNKPIANQFVLNGFGCKGDNVSPAVKWNNPPAGTKSFAVLVHDPDAPTGGAGLGRSLPTRIRQTASLQFYCLCSKSRQA
jgi:phosphatidylethanolamine-binding protein (PEBP) family uncharacterized protein